MKWYYSIWVLLLALLLFPAGCGAQTASAEMQAAIHDAYTRGRSEALETTGYNDGYEKGHEEGYEEGLETGNDQGYTKGYEKGKEDGYASGYENGKKEEHQKAYDEGYTQGVKDVNDALGADPPETPPEPPVETPPEAAEKVTYIANKNTMKYHEPDCSSVDEMKEKNKLYWYGTGQELRDKGFDPCGRCYPGTD